MSENIRNHQKVHKPSDNIGYYEKALECVRTHLKALVRIKNPVVIIIVTLLNHNVRHYSNSSVNTTVVAKIYL